jgi:flagellar assembly protein FliH
MMPLRLEVFETPSRDGSGNPMVLDPGQVEDIRLQAYENGYAAGWEDAAAAAQHERENLSAEVINNLQRLAFTYHEARNHILRSVQPLLEQVVSVFLPGLAREALAPVILDRLMPLIDQSAEAPVQLLLNPVARPAVEKLLAEAAGMDLSIIEEPTLGEGQVYLRIGDVQERVDIDAALAELLAAVADFFDYCEKEGENGQKF